LKVSSSALAAIIDFAALEGVADVDALSAIDFSSTRVRNLRMIAVTQRLVSACVQP
jgi:hypothetical protein